MQPAQQAPLNGSVENIPDVYEEEGCSPPCLRDKLLPMSPGRTVFVSALDGLRTGDPLVQAAYICANFYKRYNNLRSKIADLEPRTD